ncbi:protoporphyrinogen/coproporphyrinogen oxidase [Acetobacterium wieringae]|uniref:Uncharacterized protein n=1 Tax=Acetobacterium wieringae TaxID=52694 RepID=A0A1F2PG33_9FIRM|nr:NAD(P)-binding protein [Acetobacterium wieringae]OFV70025.1 hypothetical protein ACWI_26670 [Acetobacterium wieringae]
MRKLNTIILGAGISGMAVQYFLKTENIIIEKENYWGGLCHSFNINEFIFDTFIHLSFTEVKEVAEIFEKSSWSFKHKPRAFNYYNGHWIKHPAQNNIFSLTSEEKTKIIMGFINRKSFLIKNYEDWLRIQFGDYFAEHFPMKYTKKYWTVDAKRLETKWVGDRVYQAPIQEVIKGAFEEDKINRFYAKEMRYPFKGGYQSYLKELVDENNIDFNSKVVLIDPEKKMVITDNKKTYYYENLVSTIPLPELCKIIKGVPAEILEVAEKLNYTSGIIVSLGFNKLDIPKHLWYYIYDDDILPSRVYAPSLKSINNVPEGCSSIQAEYYFSKLNPLKYSLEEVLEKTIEKLGPIMNFSEIDIRVRDVRQIDYANVLFTKDIYENREMILNYLDKINIKCAGRFGEWDYLWSDQSLISGKKMAERINSALQ